MTSISEDLRTSLRTTLNQIEGRIATVKNYKRPTAATVKAALDPLGPMIDASQAALDAATVVDEPAPIPTPTPTPTPVPIPTPTPVPTGSISLLAFGAVGDGVTDDQAVIQRALDSLKTGQALVIDEGRTFAHSGLLFVKVPGSKVMGSGTLMATREDLSCFRIDVDDVVVDGPLFHMKSTTKRWQANVTNKVMIGYCNGVTLRNIGVKGAGGAGIYVGGSTNFLLDRVTVEDTRADAIHLTGACSDGRVLNPTIRNPGDDGVGCVSYARTGTPNRRIIIQSPRLYGQKGGRAFSVLGGEDITYNDVYAEESSSAAIYIAVESQYDTLATRRVLVNGGTIKRSNTSTTTGHGAILVYNSQAAYINEDVTIRNITIEDTQRTRQVGVISSGGTIRRIAFENITIKGGPTNLFTSTAPASASRRTGWTFNGVPVPDQIGW